VSPRSAAALADFLGNKLRACNKPGINDPSRAEFLWVSIDTLLANILHVAGWFCD